MAAQSRASHSYEFRQFYFLLKINNSLQAEVAGNHLFGQTGPNLGDSWAVTSDFHF